MQHRVVVVLGALLSFGCQRTSHVDGADAGTAPVASVPVDAATSARVADAGNNDADAGADAGPTCEAPVVQPNGCVATLPGGKSPVQADEWLKSKGTKKEWPRFSWECMTHAFGPAQEEMLFCIVLDMKRPFAHSGRAEEAGSETRDLYAVAVREKKIVEVGKLPLGARSTEYNGELFSARLQFDMAAGSIQLIAPEDECAEATGARMDQLWARLIGGPEIEYEPGGRARATAFYQQVKKVENARIRTICAAAGTYQLNDKGMLVRKTDAP